jgi:hypothetical protein
MSDVSLEMIQAMIQKILDGRRDDLLFQRDVKERLTHVETMLASQRREMALDAEGVAMLSARFDRLAEEVDRIKRRLEISDA